MDGFKGSPVTSVHTKLQYVDPVSVQIIFHIVMSAQNHSKGKTLYCSAAVIATCRIRMAGKLSRLEISGHGAHMGLN